MTHKLSLIRHSVVVWVGRRGRLLSELAEFRDLWENFSMLFVAHVSAPANVHQLYQRLTLSVDPKNILYRVIGERGVTPKIRTVVTATFYDTAPRVSSFSVYRAASATAWHIACQAIHSRVHAVSFIALASEGSGLYGVR